MKHLWSGEVVDQSLVAITIFSLQDLRGEITHMFKVI